MHYKLLLLILPVVVFIFCFSQILLPIFIDDLEFFWVFKYWDRYNRLP